MVFSLLRFITIMYYQLHFMKSFMRSIYPFSVVLDYLGYIWHMGSPWYFKISVHLQHPLNFSPSYVHLVMHRCRRNLQYQFVTVFMIETKMVYTHSHFLAAFLSCTRTS